jgi:hypothetical protein
LFSQVCAGGVKRVTRRANFEIQEDVLSVQFHPNRTSLQIMKLVHAYFTKTRKPWTLMSQKWLLEHLEKWYGVKIARSTLNYNLRILRKEGLLDTVTRHRRDPATGEFVPRVTLYKASRKLKKWFSKLASYFKRCGWVPDVKTLGKGHVPAVGYATTKEQAFLAYVEGKRRRRSAA